MKNKMFIAAVVLTAACFVASCGSASQSTDDTAQTTANESQIDSDQTEITDDTDDGSSGFISGAVDTTLRNLTEEEQFQYSNIVLLAPQNAENVTYNVLTPDTDRPIAETEFTLGSESAYVRASETNLTTDDLSSDYSQEELLEMEDYNISGLYYEWTSQYPATIGSISGDIYMSDSEGVGFVVWINDENHIVYNLCMTENADFTQLEQLANDVMTASVSAQY